MTLRQSKQIGKLVTKAWGLLPKFTNLASKEDLEVRTALGKLMERMQRIQVRLTENGGEPSKTRKVGAVIAAKRLSRKMEKERAAKKVGR